MWVQLCFLLGHLQSDAIESRCGWLRQLNGANYFISMRQVLETDRKIQDVSLVKFSCFSLKEVDEAILTSAQSLDQSDDDQTLMT